MERVKKYWKFLLGVILVVGLSFVGIRYVTASADLTIAVTESEIEIDAGSTVNIPVVLGNTFGEDVASLKITAAVDTIASGVATVGSFTTDYANSSSIPAEIQVPVTADSGGITSIYIKCTEYDAALAEIRSVDTRVIIKVPFSVGTNDIDTDSVELATVGSTSTLVSNAATSQTVTYKSDISGVVDIVNASAMMQAVGGGSATVTGSISYMVGGETYELSSTNSVAAHVKVISNNTYDGSFSHSGTTYNYYELFKNEAKKLSDMFNVINAEGVEWSLETVSGEPENIFINSEDGVIGNEYGIARLVCKPKNSTNNSMNDNVYIVVPFSFTARENLTMGVGDSLKIIDSVTDGSYNLNTAYASSNAASVINISADHCYVSAVARGEAKFTIEASPISAACASYYETKYPGSMEVVGGSNKYKKTVSVTVIDNFRLSVEEQYVNAGGTFDLYVYVSNTDSPVLWDVSGDAAAVSSQITEISSGDGLTYHKITVTGVTNGTAVVSASQTSDGITKTATCKVTVGTPVETIRIQCSKDTQVVGDVITAEAVLNESGSQPYNGNVTWLTSDSTKALVTPNESNPRQCTISCLSGGYVTITAVTEDGMMYATYNMYIEQVITGVTIEQGRNIATDFRLGQLQLSAAVAPAGDGINRNIVWTSGNNAIATVDANGLVSFVSPGAVTISAVSAADPTMWDSTEITISNPVTSIELDYTQLSLNVEFGQRLSATVLPTNASDTSVTWSSSDTSVATVSELGYVTAVSPGSCNILCTANDGNYTAVCAVTVLQPVLSISLSDATITIVKGTYFWLSATVLPENANNKEVRWVSSDTNICTVASDGQAVAVGAGKCTISAVSLDNGVTGYCEVTVTEPVTGIELNTYEENMIAGNKLMIIPTVLPVEATNKNCSFISSDPAVATVDENGIVTAVSGGSCSIMVTTEERQLSAVCNITVKEYVSSINISETQTYINYGARKQLAVSVGSETATNKGVTWSSGNPGIVSVDQAGVLTAVNYGTAVISVTANDGGGAVATCTVTVVKPVTSIGLDRKKVTIVVGETIYVQPTIYPADATIQEVKWETTDATIATVDFDGEVTGIAPGKCEVVCISTDGNNIRSTCTVTVVPLVSATGVTINSEDLVMLKGKTRALKARTQPANTTESIEWVSTDTSIVVVDSSGKITTVGPGVADVIAYSNVTGIEDNCTVHVIQMSSTNITLEQYDTHNLYVDYAPSKTISWRTSNNRIATVDANGLVTARKTGTCTIYAAIEGKTVSCTVTVVALPASTEE